MMVSQMAGTLVGSEIIKIAAEVNELKSKGSQIANLTIGDFNPEFYPIPEMLRDEITNAYKKGYTNYPPAGGVLSLRQAVSGFVQTHYQLDYSVNDILIAGGSRPLIYATYLTLIDKGDKVIYPVPSWNNNHYCHLTGADPVIVDTDAANRFLPTAKDLKNHLKDAVLIALCSPLNPTGTMFSNEGLLEICDLVLEENASRGPGRKPLYVLYDQIYSLLAFDGHVHHSPVSLSPEMRPYTILIDGASKGFASTGVRIGWGFGPAEVMANMRAIISHVGAWSPTAEQNAMAAFLKKEEAVDVFLSDFKYKVKASLDALYDGFKALEEEGFPVAVIAPMGAIYLTIKMDIVGKKSPSGEVLQNAMEVNSYLIQEAGMALVPFKAFGYPLSAPWFRASVGGCSLEDIKKTLPRLKQALAKLS